MQTFGDARIARGQAVRRVVRLKCTRFEEALRALWLELQGQDDNLPALSGDSPGVVEANGRLLRVRCVGKAAEGCVALEVLDRPGGRIWECGFGVAEGIGPVAFHFDPDGHEAHRAWAAAIEVLGVDQDLDTQYEPTFLAMAAAHLSGAGLALVVDKSLSEMLADDLAYWRQLATAQARLLKDKGSTPASLVKGGPGGDLPVVAVPVDAAAVGRVWRLRDLDEWAAQNADRIVVLPRAISAAKRAVYESPETCYAALEILAGIYRDVKRSGADRQQLLEAVTQLGLRIGGSVDPAQAGAAGDEYFIRWLGRRRFLDQHLSKGSSRDPRFTLRIYFTWDEETERAVVGWLPSHLSNSMT